MRKLLIAGLLACTCLQPALAAPVAYDEATDGDLASGLGFAFPALVFDVGSNTIKGVFSAIGASLDFDGFAFLVPAGLVITSGSVTLADGVGNVSSATWLLFSGSNLLGTGTPLGSLVPSSPGSAVAPGLPLGAAMYNVRHESFSGLGEDQSASYTFEFIVEAVAVPEPATALVLGAGLAALGLARRRRKA